MAVALAGLYLDIDVHRRMIITGLASIHGMLGSVAGIKQKAIAGLENFPGETVNMIIPQANTVGSAVWKDYCYIKRDHIDGHNTIRREWLKFNKGNRSRLNVFAAETLYDVLDLAIVAPSGMAQ